MHSPRQVLSAAMMATNENHCSRRSKIKLRYLTRGNLLRGENNVDLPCLTDTYLVLEAATKLACGRESSSENNSSFVTVLDLVFKAARDPMGAK